MIDRSVRLGLAFFILLIVNSAQGQSPVQEVAPSKVVATNPEVLKPGKARTDTPPRRTQVLIAKLLDRRYVVTGYREDLFFDIEFLAGELATTTDSIEGIVEIDDLKGEAQMRINLTIRRPTKSGETFVVSGQPVYFNRFMKEHVRVKGADLSELKTSFTANTVLYKDGTREVFY